MRDSTRSNHVLKNHPKFYGVWANMKERCDNETYSCYRNYGGRGIKYEPRWADVNEFYRDMFPAYKLGLTLDRRDNNKGYTPENCRWVSQQVQQNNRRNNHNITWQGKTQTLTQWARELGLKEKTLSARLIDYKWPVEKAMTAKHYVSNQFIESRTI